MLEALRQEKAPWHDARKKLHQHRLLALGVN
jgi:hypothetical protein